MKNNEKSRQEVRLVQPYPSRKMKKKRKKKKKLRPVCQFSLPLCGFPFSKRLITFSRHLEHFEKVIESVSNNMYYVFYD